jgi:ABC-type uncharacterized transport system substrate-binding protein
MFSAIKSFRSLSQALLLCSLALAPVCCWAENLKVIVLLSDNSAPYQSFASVFGKNLPAQIQTTVIEYHDPISLDATQADLIVAAGMKAAELSLTQTSTPVLAAMIPRSGYENLLAQAHQKKSPPAISAIYLNQPWDRQLDFLHAALPTRHRIGLLYSADSRIAIAPLRQLISARGSTLNAQLVQPADELFSSLENVLEKSDVLLAAPDSTIYSSSNIRNILLASYRHNVPLIGLSQAYVNAGALCAIFSTPQQLAEQAAVTVVSFAQTRRLPEPLHPVDFTVAVNQQVARSLGIELPPPEAIRNRMNKAKEESP